MFICRKIMEKVSYLKKCYPFGAEDELQLVFKDYVGEVNVNHEWVVLVRCVLNTHSSEVSSKGLGL